MSASSRKEFDIQLEDPNQSYRLFLLQDTDAKTLASVQIELARLGSDNGVFLYQDNQDPSSSSSGSRKFNAYFIQNGKWVGENHERKSVSMGNLLINKQVVLSPDERASIIAEALFRLQENTAHNNEVTSDLSDVDSSSSGILETEKNNLLKVLSLIEELKGNGEPRNLTLRGHYTADDYKTLQIEMDQEQWCVTLETEPTDNSLQSFILDGLENNTIVYLNIATTLPDNMIDSIIHACVNFSTIRRLYISQPVSNTQANVLYKLLSKEELERIEFSGEHLSEEIAKKFAYYDTRSMFYFIKISNSEFYDTYSERLHSLKWIVLDKILCEDFNLTSDELSEMVTNMEQDNGQNSQKNPFILDRDLSIRKDFSDPLWIPFFTNFITKRSGVLIRLGDEFRELEYPEIMITAILQALENCNNFRRVEIYGFLMIDQIKQLAKVLRTNTTIKTFIVTEGFFETESLCELIDAITHNQQSAVTELQIGDYQVYEDIGNSLKKLLTINKTLISLELTTTFIPKAPFTQLAEGLESNKTLKHLALRGNGIDCHDLILIGKSLEKNITLTSLVLPHLHVINESPWSALKQFLYSSRLNTKLQELILSFRYPIFRESRSDEPTKQVLDYLSELKKCTDMNKEIYQRDLTMELDEYFLTASVLFQAVRTHPNHFKTDICFIILSMLAPSFIEKDKLTAATDLIENNINNKKWDKVGKIKLYWGERNITLFKSWEKFDESLAAVNRSAKLGCKF